MPSLPRHVLFIDALSDDEVRAMLDGDYAEHATLEIQRRVDAERAKYVAFAAGVLARYADGEPVGPREKRMNEIVCECSGDLREAAARFRAELPSLPPDPRTDEEKKAEHRVWFYKRTGVRLGPD